MLSERRHKLVSINFSKSDLLREPLNLSKAISSNFGTPGATYLVLSYSIEIHQKPHYINLYILKQCKNTMSDSIKEAFAKVRQDIEYLYQEIADIKCLLETFKQQQSNQPTN